MKKMTVLISMLCVLSVSALFADAKKDMIGYWKVDADLLKKSIDKKLSEIPAEQRKMAEGMMKMMSEMLKNFVIQITEKEQIAITPKGEEKKAYTVVKVDGEKVTMKIGEKETTLVVKKGSIYFNENNFEMTMLKVTKEVFEENKKKMLAMAEKMKKAQGGTTPPAGK